MQNKRWFSKVLAFEHFSDFWSYGQNESDMPTHNIYVPTENPIMPIPKFRDYDKEDHEGKDFTHRNRNSHTVSPINQPNTLKPEPFQPPTTSRQNQRAFYNKQVAHVEHYRKMKWTKDRKLSKSKQKRWTSVNMPHKWSFSTLVNRKTEEQEQQEIKNFNKFAMLYTYSKSFKGWFN